MGDAEDLLANPEAYLDDPAPEMRRLAISVLGDDAAQRDRVARVLRSDPSPQVRAEAAEVLGSFGAVSLRDLLAATAVEQEPEVIESLAAALGEVEDPVAVPWLLGVAAGDHGKLAQETAVASLGAIGDERALAPLLDLVREAPPQVRRRAVVALTGFDVAPARAAIRRAARDRNPMVREAAEMIVGR